MNVTWSQALSISEFKREDKLHWEGSPLFMLMYCAGNWCTRKSAMIAVLLWAHTSKKKSAADGNREDTTKEIISRLRLGDSKSWGRRDRFKFRVREAGRGCLVGRNERFFSCISLTRRSIQLLQLSEMWAQTDHNRKQKSYDKPSSSSKIGMTKRSQLKLLYSIHIRLFLFLVKMMLTFLLEKNLT